MRTLEEYKEYCKQLEGDVKKWREAYQASQAENKELLNQLRGQSI